MSFRLLSRLTHTQAVFLMVAVTLMWSIAGVVTRQLESAARFEVTFWRSAFTALSLLIILPLWRSADRAAGSLTDEVGQGPLQRHWGVQPGSSAFWMSGVCWSVMFTAFMLALTFTTVANVLIIMAVGPLFTALLARFTIGQTLAPRTWAAIAAAGLGIVYMYGSQFLQAFATPDIDTSALVIGSLVALCVPIAGAVNWTVMQRSQTHGRRIDLVPSVLLGGLISSLLTLPLALPFEATGGDIAWLALLGLVQLAIPCALAVVCARSLKAPLTPRVPPTPHTRPAAARSRSGRCSCWQPLSSSSLSAPTSSCRETIGTRAWPRRPARRLIVNSATCRRAFSR